MPNKRKKRRVLPPQHFVVKKRGVHLVVLKDGKGIVRVEPKLDLSPGFQPSRREPVFFKRTVSSLKQEIGSELQDDLFQKKREKHIEQYKIVVNENERGGPGFTFSQTASMVYEGFLKKLHQTDFNPEQRELIIDPSYLLGSKYAKGDYPINYFGSLGNYEYNNPVIIITQAEWLQLSGIGRGFWAVQKFRDALDELQKNYWIYYTRKNFKRLDKEGKPAEEEVLVLDKALNIKAISENGKLIYYEVSPSVVSFDQRDSYFIMIPEKWREEAKKLLPSGRITLTLARLILFMIFQYERKRSKGAEKKIDLYWDTLSRWVIIPKTIRANHPKRAKIMLETAFEEAKLLGYITKWDSLLGKETKKGLKYILTLNPEKYYNPKPDKVTEAS